MNDLTVSNLFTSNALSGLSLGSAGNNPDVEATSFQDLLSLMLLSSVTSADNQTGDITSLLSPLILLLEQLQSQQLTTQFLPSSNNSQPKTTSIHSSPVNVGGNSFPVQARLTQGYHPGHNGLDFGVVVGTPVHSTIQGKVVYAGWNNEGYGNLVIVDNGTYKTYYAHLSEIPVSIGQTVHRGEVVGLSGNTGNSTGPHLHYEVRKNNRPIDPNTFDPNSI